MAAGDELERGAPQRQRIDAGMGAEAPVFIGEQQLEIAGIDAGFGVDRQPPAAVGHGIGAQQLAVAVDDRGGDLPRLRQRQRTERDDPGGEGADRQDDDRDGDASDANGARSPNAVMAGLDPAMPTSLRYGQASLAHFAGRTSTDPVPVRP